MAESKRPIVLLYAEGLREAGILIVVFGPMYSTFDTTDVGWSLFLDVVAWFLFGSFLFRLGIEVERRSS